MSELCRYPDVTYAPGLGCTLTGTSAIGVLEIIEELHAPKTVRRKEERVNEWRRVVRDPQYL